ncbi:MAG: MFS transporter [Clostridia bacterium]|nr:MFS transporter [Clostridia bacterium]MBQ4322593.1 MFS transporter [Clostridia bacterium]
MEAKFKRLKIACYTTNITMSVVGNLSPILFLTFHSLYGISYSLLGLLVLINFCTQLGIDLVFSFFSHKFNIPKTVKLTPVIAVVGLLVYAILPMLFPSYSYLGIVIGTVIFSAASGLAEVLISPVIAAIPAKDPDREMSKLHSIYAWGVVGVVVVSTVYLLLVDNTYWYFLALFFALIPLLSALLFAGSEIPKMDTPEKTTGALHLLKNKGIWLSVFAIFLGGAAECTMAQWASGYLEQSLGIPKVYGDLFGVAMFAMMLGLGRSLYAKIGKNVERVLLLGGIGAAICYGLAAVTPFPILGLAACGFAGFCTSMLWPGNLVVASNRFPTGGVFIYALMAAGGDLGASVVPQAVGIITDLTVSHPEAAAFAESLSLTPDQLGMKLGMLVGMLFPLIGIPVYAAILKGKKKYQQQ